MFTTDILRLMRLSVWRVNAMAYCYIQQLLACAAILLAVVLFQLLPSSVRKAFFIVMFSTGMLAAAAGIATSAADAAVLSLFG
jgi:hypothetical protein